MPKKSDPYKIVKRFDYDLYTKIAAASCSISLNEHRDKLTLAAEIEKFAMEIAAYLIGVK